MYEVVEDNLRWLYDKALEQTMEEANEMVLRERMDGLSTFCGQLNQSSESIRE